MANTQDDMNGYIESLYCEAVDEDCARTLALCDPGVPVEGLKCHYAWTGAIPCTGRLACTLCGKDRPTWHQHSVRS